MKSSPRKSINSNEWIIGETKFVPITSAICGKKTEHSRLKLEESLTSYRYLWVGNLIVWEASNRIRFFPLLQYIASHSSNGFQHSSALPLHTYIHTFKHTYISVWPKLHSLRQMLLVLFNLSCFRFLPQRFASGLHRWHAILTFRIVAMFITVNTNFFLDTIATCYICYTVLHANDSNCITIKWGALWILFRNLCQKASISIPPPTFALPQGWYYWWQYITV
jgi:hypothetical protein